MSRYTHTLTGQEARAVESLPDFSLPNKQAQKAIATGTERVSSFNLHSEIRNLKYSPAFCQKQPRPAGLEPATFGFEVRKQCL